MRSRRDNTSKGNVLSGPIQTQGGTKALFAQRPSRPPYGLQGRLIQPHHRVLLRAKQLEQSRAQELKRELNLENEVQRDNERGLRAPDGFPEAHALRAAVLRAVGFLAVIEIDEVVELAEGILELTCAEQARQPHLFGAVLLEGLPRVEFVKEHTGKGNNTKWEPHLLSDFPDEHAVLLPDLTFTRQLLFIEHTAAGRFLEGRIVTNPVHRSLSSTV
jgi:hypothetical protein